MKPTPHPPALIPLPCPLPLSSPPQQASCRRLSSWMSLSLGLSSFVTASMVPYTPPAPDPAPRLSAQASSSFDPALHPAVQVRSLNFVSVPPSPSAVCLAHPESLGFTTKSHPPCSRSAPLPPGWPGSPSALTGAPVPAMPLASCTLRPLVTQHAAARKPLSAWARGPLLSVPSPPLPSPGLQTLRLFSRDEDPKLYQAALPCPGGLRPRQSPPPRSRHPGLSPGSPACTRVLTRPTRGPRFPRERGRPLLCWHHVSDTCTRVAPAGGPLPRPGSLRAPAQTGPPGPDSPCRGLPADSTHTSLPVRVPTSVGEVPGLSASRVI